MPGLSQHRAVNIWPTVCSEWPTVCSEWPTVCSEWPTVCSEWPTECSEWPTECSEWPTVCSEWPTVCSEWPTACVEGGVCPSLPCLLSVQLCALAELWLHARRLHHPPGERHRSGAQHCLYCRVSDVHTEDGEDRIGTCLVA